MTTAPTRTALATAGEVLADIWTTTGGDTNAIHSVSLTGAEPVLPSSFAVDAVAQGTIAASALAAADIWRRRTGQAQGVSVDRRHAAAEFRSERYMHVDGFAAHEWDKIAGVYQAGDGRYLRLHTNLPHHRAGILKLLGVDYDRANVAQALNGWNADAFETAATEAGLVVAMMRSPSEWARHPQSAALAAVPVINITRIGDAPPRSWGTAPSQPLSGLRVLDLTRIIAGPVCGRTLAAHGADVLLITSPRLPSVQSLVMDSGRGKLSAHLDLTEEAARETLQGLLRSADVFVQGYRPGSIATKGFSPERCAELSPGIVCVSLSAYGDTGPWGGKRGFDSLVQTATGLNHAEADAAGISGPKELPAQALDHASGYLMAVGAMMAVARQRTEGGSWLVRVSLARTGAWLTAAGQDPSGLSAPDLKPADVADLIETTESGFGPMRALRHAGILDTTPARWTLPSVPLGTHPAAWPSH